MPKIAKMAKYPAPKKTGKKSLDPCLFFKGIFVCSQNGCHPEVEKVAIINLKGFSQIWL